MKRFVALLIAFSLGAFTAFQLLHLLGHSQPPEHGEGAETPEHHDESRPASIHVERLGQGVSKVSIPTNLIENLHLKVAAIATEETPVETRVYGRVLDPAPLIAAVVEAEAAVASVKASRQELARSRALFAQDQNASARSVEAAEAAATRDELQLQGSRLKLASGWGSALASRTNLAELTGRLARQELAIVRLDSPLSEPWTRDPTQARVAPAGSDEPLAAVEILGPMPAADPASPGRGVIGLVQSRGFAHGTALAGWVRTDAPAQPLPVVPQGALLRHDGRVYVQVAEGPGIFERRPITLDRPWKDGWTVAHGLKAGESIVTEGAQQLLSAELNAGGAGEE